MWPNPQETADLVTFTEEILNGKLHFLCSKTWTLDNSEFTKYFRTVECNFLKQLMASPVTKSSVLNEYEATKFVITLHFTQHM